MGVFNKVIVNDSDGNTLYQLKPNLPLSFYNTSSDKTDFNVKNMHWGLNQAKIYFEVYWNCGSFDFFFTLDCNYWNFYALTMDDIRDPTLPYPASWNVLMRAHLFIDINMDLYDSNDSYIGNATESFGAQANYNRYSWPCIGDADYLNIGAGSSRYRTSWNPPRRPFYVIFRSFTLRPQIALFGDNPAPYVGVNTGQRGEATMRCPLVGAYNPNANQFVNVTSYCNVPVKGSLSTIGETTQSLNKALNTKFKVSEIYELGPLDFNCSIDPMNVYYRKQLTLL